MPRQEDMERRQSGDTTGGRPQRPALNWAELCDLPAGAEVNVAVEIRAVYDEFLAGELLEPNPANPFKSYRRSRHALRIHRTPDTTIAMGTADDIVTGVPIWVRGDLRADEGLDARGIAVLASVAEVEG
jgi:hypothetical protein